jgi:hypothetical protein
MHAAPYPPMYSHRSKPECEAVCDWSGCVPGGSLDLTEMSDRSVSKQCPLSVHIYNAVQTPSPFLSLSSSQTEQLLNSKSSPGNMDKYTSSQPLLPHSFPSERSSSKKSLALLLSLFALLALLVPSPLNPLNASLSSWKTSPATLKNTCGQAEAIIPDGGVHDIASVWKEKDRIVSWHQGAIRVPTQVYDEMGEPGEDHRWDIFQELHDCTSTSPATVGGYSIL